MNLLLALGDDSGDESEEEEERRDEDRNEEEETEDSGDPESPVRERAPSPEEEVVLSASNSHQEHIGPSEEEDAEFAKELAKMVTDISAESRKVDKKTALALWDNAILPPVGRKKRVDDKEQSNGAAETMAFTLITKRGNKQTVSLRNIFAIVVLTCTLPIAQTREISVPAASALAVQTRSAQLQDKVEQQHLKRLVLDYEQREEAEELKGEGISLFWPNCLLTSNVPEALEIRNRAGVKVRHVG